MRGAAPAREDGSRRRWDGTRATGSAWPSATGREAVTEYERLGARAVTRCSRCGRRRAVHQLRAYLAYLGLPIAGDLRTAAVRGLRDLQRQFLHAARLTLDRPADGRRLAAWSELPADLVASLDDVGIASTAPPSGVGAIAVLMADQVVELKTPAEPMTPEEPMSPDVPMPQPERDPEPDKRMTFPNPMLVVVSGPSGVGKSTIVAELAERRPVSCRS